LNLGNGIQASTVRTTILSGALAGLLVGGLGGHGMATRAVVLNVIGMTGDSVLLGLYLVVIYGIVGAVAGLLIGGGLSLFGLQGRRMGGRTVFAVSLGVLAALYLFLSGMRLYNRDLYFYDYSFIHSLTAMRVFFAARTVAMAAAAVAAGYALFRLSRRAPSFTALGLIVVVGALGLVLNLTGREPERITTSRLPVVERDAGIPKILLIGWDGATWTVMNRLLDAGAMPNTRRLTERGTFGNLKSPSGTVSADIWTRIYTGKDKSKHGIYGFDYYRVPGLSRPIVPPWRGLGVARLLSFLRRERWIETVIANRTLCRATPVWRIMNDMGRTAGVVGPLISWPAEAVEPFLISSTAGDIAERVREDATDLEAFLGSDLYYPSNLDDDIVSSILKAARWRDEVGVPLYRTYRPDFFTIYFEEPDRTQHFRWKWMEPRYYSGVTEEDLARYGGAIEREYVLADSLLGEFLRIAGDSTTILVTSDHGFSPTYRGGPQQAGHYGGPDGILIAAGPAVRQGARLIDAHVRDIAPTLLALGGLPVADDMDGRVLVEIIAPDFLEMYPVQRTPTYETGTLATTVRRSGATDGLYEKLRALGYVGG